MTNGTEHPEQKARELERIPDEFGCARFTKLVTQLADRGIHTDASGRELTTAPGMITIQLLEQEGDARFERFWVSAGELLTQRFGDITEFDESRGQEASLRDRLAIFDLLDSVVQRDIILSQQK